MYLEGKFNRPDQLKAERFGARMFYSWIQHVILEVKQALEFFEICLTRLDNSLEVKN